MPTYIYMNEKIRMQKPDGPVIRVQEGKGGKCVDTNEARLFVGRKCVGRVVYDPAKNPSTTHEVKAWVEFSAHVKVVP